MEEIEFRVWNGSRYCYDIAIYHGEPYAWNNEESELVPFFTDDQKNLYGIPIVEQFIGIIDKNANRIYEGDILKTNELDWIGECTYRYGWFLLTDNNHGFSSPAWDLCEVIGNIHENPELLA